MVDPGKAERYITAWKVHRCGMEGPWGTGREGGVGGAGNQEVLSLVRHL